MRLLSNFPLMALMLIIYNGVAFGLMGEATNWETPVFTLRMMSDAIWTMRLGDVVIAIGLFVLFFEILKATRIGRLSIVDHLLSTLVLLIFVVEFLLVPAAATPTFFILMLMVLLDVMAGFSVSIRTATRDVSLGDGL